MTEHHWVRVAPCDQIPPRQGRSVSIGGRELAIFNLGPSTALGTSPSTGPGSDLGSGPGSGPGSGLGSDPSGLEARHSTALGVNDLFFATDNQCPHKGGPLCDGIVTGRAVVCPLHAWKINLTDGRVERPQGAGEQCITTYPVRVDDGVISVSVPL